MKKKILALIMASLMGITLVACGEEKKEPTADNKPSAEEPVDGGQTENVKLTEDDVKKIMKDMEVGLKSEFSNAKELQVKYSDRNNVLTCSLETVKPDPLAQGYTYDGIKYDYANAISKGSHDSIDIEFSMEFKTEDIDSGKVKFDINKTMIPKFYKYLIQDGPDLVKYNDEINEELDMKSDGEGSMGDVQVKEEGKITFAYTVDPAIANTSSVVISISRDYK